MKSLKIKDPIYYRQLEVIVNCSLEEIERYIFVKRDIPKSPLPTAGFHLMLEHISTQRREHFIVLREFHWRIADYGLLTHEVFHFVNDAMGDLGMTLSESSAEAYAYYHQFIFQEILKGLKSKGIE